MDYKQSEITQVAKEMGIDGKAIALRKAFLEFDHEDVVRLSKIHASLSESQIKFIDHFYEHILSFEALRQLLPETSQAERLKKTQSDYFEKLSKGFYDWDYVLDRLKVGITHDRNHLDLEWYIGAYRKYLSLLLHHLTTESGIDSRHIQTLDSLIKIIFFDMGLAIDTYVYSNNQTIKRLEQQLNNLIQGLDGFVWEFDVAQYKYVYVSQQAESMLGYPQKCWLESPEFQHQIIHHDDVNRTKQAFNHAISEGSHQEIEYRIIVANGESLWVNERINAEKNHDGEVILLRGLILDIKARKEYEAQLAYMATYDELTGLPNRNFFESRLNEALANAKRKGSQLAIMFLDLDGFKDINDSLGHNAGDQLLQIIGRRLKKTLREAEFASRFGGDEFCIILENISEEQIAANVAHRCLATLEKSTCISSHDIFPRASIGISIFPQDGETVELLLQCADSAMYAAKTAGKHQVAFYNIKMTDLAEQRLSLENDLRQALKREEFELVYQPQVSLKSGKLVAVEALIRWRHPLHGIVTPDKFIPVTEKMGLIVPLGEWVLNQACRQIVKWHQSSVSVSYIAINISGSHFCDDTLSDALIKAMSDTGAKTSDIELEITESVVQATEASLKNFEEIKKLGIKIAIDDFGTGYSCLDSLTQLPIDSLKIDRAFVKNMLTEANKSTIVATIIAMSRALGFSVVAEGVETVEQVSYLQGIGCDSVQGYYFSKPVAADQITKLAMTDFFQKESEL